MKTNLLILLLLASSATALAQQPFEEYGYKVKVGTLSNGKYQEFFDQDTLVQIGSVVLNTVSGEVVYFVTYDTVYSEATLQPELISRWLSPDPLSDEFASFSPYNFVLNNPIKFVDPDGRAPVPNDVITTLSNVQTNGYGMVNRQAEIVVTMKVVNMNGSDLSKTMFAGGKGTVDVTSTFGGTGVQLAEGGLGPVQTDITSVKIQFEVVDNLDAVGKNDHVMMIVNNIPEVEYDGKKSDPVGLATRSGRISAVESGTLKDGSFNEVAQHELGHNLGLKHRAGTLMNENVSGTTTTNGMQKGEVAAGTHVGPADKNGTYKASSTYGRTHSKTLAQEFLKSSNIK